MPDQLQGIVQRMLDAGESEDNIATVIQHFKSQAPPPVERGGLMHPLTSMVAPELEAVRGKVNDALATPPGTPIMARSRTGSLYRSETGPSNPTDFAKNLGRATAGAAIDQVEGATSPLGVAAYGVSKIPVAPIARGAAAVIENVPYARKVIPFADATAGRLRTIAQGSQDASMGVTRGADMYSMERFPRSTESTARVPMTHGEPAPITDADRITSLIDQAVADGELRQGVRGPKGVPHANGFIRAGRIEPVPSHAPAVGPDMVPVGDEAAYNAAHAQAAPVEQTDAPLLPSDQIRRDLLDPEMVRKATEMQQSAQTARLQQPRVDIGAERVGRAQGLTTDQVRAQTAPILGEAPGAASPILPEKALQSIIDKMKALPREGGAREAYVQAATSGKAQWQIENIRRTLEHLGLLIPAAATVAPSVRDMLLQKMRAGVTAPQTAQ